MDDVTYMILKVVLSVAAALITAYLVPYIKARTSAETQARVSEVVSVAVQAAEQTLQGGTVKKEDVTDYVTRWLAMRGIKMDKDDLNRLIEAVVYSVKQGQKEQ